MQIFQFFNLKNFFLLFFFTKQTKNTYAQPSQGNRESRLPYMQEEVNSNVTFSSPLTMLLCNLIICLKL